MNEDIRTAMITKQIERNMPALKALMAYSDAHSTPDQHDQIVTILSECVLELFGVLEDQDRRVAYLRNIRKQEVMLISVNNLEAAAWYRTYYKMVVDYFAAFNPFLGVDEAQRIIPAGADGINEPTTDDPLAPWNIWGVYWNPTEQ